MNWQIDVPRLSTPNGINFIALDVDGTLLTPDHKITTATRESVSRVRAAGVTVVVASARGPAALRPILEELELGEDWFIAYQGALVSRSKNHEVESLLNLRIARDSARTIEGIANEMDLTISQYVGERWLVTRMNSEISQAATITGETPIVMSSEDLDREPGPHKMMVIVKDPLRRADLHTFARRLPSLVTGTFSHDDYLEVTSLGVDKAVGIRTLANHLGVDLKLGAAVGDGVNDIGMFKVVSCAIAMGQAPDEVKAAADFVTLSNANDGLAAALEALVAMKMLGSAPCSHLLINHKTGR